MSTIFFANYSEFISMSDEDDDNYRCNKTSFLKAFKPNAVYSERIQNLVSDCQRLVFHTTHCLKFYILSQPDYNVDINQYVIGGFINLLNGDFNPRKHENRDTINAIRPTIDTYLSIFTNFKKPGIPCIQQLSHYLTTTIVTNLTVNIKSHFMPKLLQFINTRLNVKNNRRVYKGNVELTKEYNARLYRVKKLILNDPDAIDIQLTELEEIVQGEVLSIIGYNNCEISLAYRVIADPMSFVSAYCRLSSMYETYEIKMFSAIPLRTSLINKHIPIDTVILCRIILCEPKLIKTMMDNKVEIWGRVFNVNGKAFKSRSVFTFNGRITTDGTSISVYLQQIKPNRRKKRKRVDAKTRAEELRREYVENHIDDINGRDNFVADDPNKRDLQYCRDPFGNKLRYTSNQRAHETGSRRYMKIRRQLIKESGYDEIESKIPTHKSMDYEKYKQYLRIRNDSINELEQFYNQGIHNRLKWRSYMNKQRSEQKFINEFKDVYGKKAVVIMGNWSDAGHTPKFQKSSKTRGWKKLFNRNHMKFVLIDEFRTSTFCPNCNSNVEYVFKRESPKPWRKGRVEMVHGLLGCKNLNCLKQDGTKQRYWNRDDLATLNMIDIVINMLSGDGRPIRFRRKN